MMPSRLEYHLSSTGEAGFVPNHDQIDVRKNRIVCFANSPIFIKNKYNLTRKRTYVCNEEVDNP